MANKFIAYWDMHDVRVSPEVHYNNYGTRGVVDLYQHAGKIAYELKSENAVKSVSGANAIVRQYNKMRENFNDGSNHTADYFDLLFAPSKHNLFHLINNASIYNSIESDNVRIGVLLMQENGIATWFYVKTNGEYSNSLPQSLHGLEKYVTGRENEDYSYEESDYLLNVLRGGF